VTGCESLHTALENVMTILLSVINLHSSGCLNRAQAHYFLFFEALSIYKHHWHTAATGTQQLQAHNGTHWHTAATDHWHTLTHSSNRHTLTHTGTQQLQTIGTHWHTAATGTQWHTAATGTHWHTMAHSSYRPHSTQCKNNLKAS